MKPDKRISISNLEQTTLQLAKLALQETHAMLLGGHSGHDPYGKYLLLVALGMRSGVAANAAENPFDQLQEAWNSGGWWFGHLAYDLKNTTEALESHHPAWISWPDLSWFQPEIVCAVTREEPDMLQVFGTKELVLPPYAETASVIAPPAFEAAESAQEYLERIQRIRDDIAAGTYYEMNHCVEFRAGIKSPDLAGIWQRMYRRTPAPFSALYRCGSKTAFCASPERFLCLRNGRLISQPIKGTAPRNPDPEEDERLRQALAADPKNRAENVMIVDLVRNDLSRTCIPGSVQVPELFGVHSFAQVHQLISTVTGLPKPGIRKADMISAAFPMGSMTGAPKVEVMKHIEEYENFRRGLYSGSLGYCDPDGDFDLNVVIRTLQFDYQTQRMAYHTGGAITWDSDPQKEKEECRWKAASVLRMFD
jgi:para-aminobenzoate synthetase component 1